MRMPMQLRLECDVTGDRSQTVRVAVALLAPVSVVTARSSCACSSTTAIASIPSTVRVARIDAVSDESIWYPYGGGSFGAEMML